MEPQLPLCSKCGYDLTGLNAVGRCPECGQPFNTKTRKGMKSDKDDMYRADRIFKQVRIGLLLVGGFLILSCAGMGVLPTRRAAGIAASIAVVMLLGALAAYATDRE